MPVPPVMCVPRSAVRFCVRAVMIAPVPVAVTGDLSFRFLALRFLNLSARLGVCVASIAFVLMIAVMNPLLRFVLLNAMRTVAFAIFPSVPRLFGQRSGRNQHSCDTEQRCNSLHAPLLLWVYAPRRPGGRRGLHGE